MRNCIVYPLMQYPKREPGSEMQNFGCNVSFVFILRSVVSNVGLWVCGMGWSGVSLLAWHNLKI